MSNYTQSTNFATKDALSSGDPLKIVKGTEINTEFNNIAIAVATKADLVSPTFTGTPTLPTGTIATTQSFGNSTTALATTAFVQAAMAALHPVGSIYINASNTTNPGTLLGFGTWTAFGAGRVPVGFDSTNVLFDTAEETGGSADAVVVSHTHTATVTDPGHLHVYQVKGGAGLLMGGGTYGETNSSVNTSSATTGVTVANSTTGTSGTNANYQPYITVYMWKRTA
jgi:hypothetical protein